VNFDDQDLQQTLSGIKWLTDNTKFDHILWNGDLNADFNKNSSFVNTVSEFIDNCQLQKAWDKFRVDFTYCSHNDTSFSRIDHFIYNEKLNENIIDAGIIHHGDNVSGHSPIYIKLKTDNLPRIEESEQTYYPKQDWNKANKTDIINYKMNLQNRMSNIEIDDNLRECKNLHCSNIKHKEGLDKYLHDIIENIEEATKQNIPYTRPKKENVNTASKRKHIPGWNDLVEPYKSEARFWYQCWLSANKPIGEELHQNMRKSRANFKLAKRKCINAAEYLKRENLMKHV